MNGYSNELVVPGKPSNKIKLKLYKNVLKCYRFELKISFPLATRNSCAYSIKRIKKFVESCSGVSKNSFNIAKNNKYF